MTKDELIRRSWDEGICPKCGQKIAERKGIGTGRKADGTFCSLDCIAAFHGKDFIRRHQERLERISRAQQN
jgi:hypothetical protein